MINTHKGTAPVRIAVFLWMSVRGCAWQLFGCVYMMVPCQGKVVTPATTHVPRSSSLGSRGLERRSAATTSPFLLAEHIQLDRRPRSGPRSRWLGTRSPISVKTWALLPVLQSFISHPVTHANTPPPPHLLICCFKDLPEDILRLIDVPPPCGDTAELLTGVSETPQVC